MVKVFKMLIIIVLGVAFAITMTSNADADDWKCISGAVCSAAHPANAAYLRYWHTGLYNSKSTHVLVTCPIIRDQHGYLDSDSLEIAGVVIDQGEYRFTRCWLKLITGNGATTYQLVGERNGSGNIAFDADIITSPSPGYITIQCLMAPKSVLNRIWIEENSDIRPTGDDWIW